MPSGNALNNDPNFPSKMLFSNHTLTFGEEKLAKSTERSSLIFKFKDQGNNVVFTFADIRFCGWIVTWHDAIFLFPCSAALIISLIRCSGTGTVASIIVPFKSEKLLSIIFWNIFCKKKICSR